jgi:hypothetical protein
MDTIKTHTSGTASGTNDSAADGMAALISCQRPSPRSMDCPITTSRSSRPLNALVRVPERLSGVINVSRRER